MRTGSPFSWADARSGTAGSLVPMLSCQGAAGYVPRGHGRSGLVSQRVPVSLHPHQLWCTSGCSRPCGVPSGFHLHVPLTDGTEHLLTGSLAVYIVSLEKCLLNPLLTFKLVLWGGGCRSSSQTLDPGPVDFLPFCELSLHFLDHVL